MRFDVSNLTQSLVKRGVEEESVRPTIMLTLYSDLSLHMLGPHAATALQKYMHLIPKEVLRSAKLDSGDAGKLSPRRIARDLRRLNLPPRNADYEELIYSSSELGPPGDYGITFLIDDLTDPDFADNSNLLRFEFPASFADSPHDTIGLVTDLVECVPYTVGDCGFGFSHWHGDKFAAAQIYQLLPRYAGFGHSSQTPRKWIKQQTPSPNWLTFIGRDLMDELGGEAVLATHAPEAKVSELQDGFMIRAAKYPPIGDVNQGAPDLGSLPGIARFLKPKRTVIPFLRGRGAELDTESWLSRVDNRENGPWDNG